MRRALLPLCLLTLFTLTWPWALRAWFEPEVAQVLAHDQVHPLARGLARRQLAVWSNASPAATRAREANPEWAFMGRTFLAWSAANLALREPEKKAEHLAAVDALIARTLTLEAQHGFRHFLMAYGQRDPFVANPERSLFVDGEVALMLALRRLVEDRPQERALLQARLAAMEAQLRASPLLAAESYPDECWTFDHANALAAFRIADVLDGTDHRALIHGWLKVAKERLLDPATGMLVSSYHLDGTVKDGPEGSTLWLAAHALEVVDPAFARAQYALAREHLGHSIAGFELAREWPHGSAAQPDIDSGVQVPLVEASPSSSAFALMAAASFGDGPSLRGLLASLSFAAFPVEDETGTHFAASNAVGDSVILYALTLGPAWDSVRRRSGARAAETGEPPAVRGAHTALTGEPSAVRGARAAQTGEPVAVRGEHAALTGEPPAVRGAQAQTGEPPAVRGAQAQTGEPRGEHAAQTGEPGGALPRLDAPAQSKHLHAEPRGGARKPEVGRADVQAGASS